MRFQNNSQKFFDLYDTAFMLASTSGRTEIVRLLVKQEGIDINAKDIYLFYSKFISIILYFKIIFENSLKYMKQHLC